MSFWSNFEIGDFDFSVMKLMIIGLNILILQGNFIMNDGVMHQYIQLELVYLLIKIKFIFKDIGYDHDPYTNCPNTETTQMCEIGKFSRWEHLYDQNSLEDTQKFMDLPLIYMIMKKP